MGHPSPARFTANQGPTCPLRFLPALVFAYPGARRPSPGRETYTAKWVSVFCLLGWSKPKRREPRGEQRKLRETGGEREKRRQGGLGDVSNHVGLLPSADRASGVDWISGDFDRGGAAHVRAVDSSAWTAGLQQ